VHNETYKVLGGLNRTDARAPEDEPEEHQENLANGAPTAEGDVETVIAKEGDTGTVEEPITKKPKEKKKGAIVGGVNTLESNIDSLNIKKFDLEFTVDPLFKKKHQLHSMKEVLRDYY